MIRGHAVSEGVRSAGVVGDVAANGTSGLAARIGRVEESVFGHGSCYIGIDDAGLDDGDTILQIDFENAIQPGQRQDDAEEDRLEPRERTRHEPIPPREPPSRRTCAAIIPDGDGPRPPTR